MKQKFIYALFCLATLFTAVSCSDDKEDNLQVIDPNELLFKVQEVAITANTFTFNVLSSDQKTPYICLYVDKAVIDAVPQEKLHEFLMEDLKKQAAQSKKNLEEYLASIAHVGNMPRKTLENLASNSLYELVIFGINGVTMADVPFLHFFQTDLADQIDFPIEATYEAVVGKTEIFVTPANKEQKYYSTVIPLKTYQEGKAMGMNDSQMINRLFNGQLQQELQRLQMMGQYNPEGIQKMFDRMLLQGDKKLTLGRGVVAGTAYAWLGAAMYVNENFDFKFISETSVLQPIQTKPLDKIEGVTYDFQIQNERVNKVHLKLVPSKLDLGYYWKFMPHTPATLNATPLELAQKEAEQLMRFPPFMVNNFLSRGVFEQKDYSITPGMKHYMMSFGYNGGIVTDVTMKDYDPIPLGDAASVTFQVENTECTSDKLNFQITPSDEKVCYLPMVYPVGEDKEAVKGDLIAHFHRQVDNKQNSPWGGNPYYTLWEAFVAASDFGQQEFPTKVLPGDQLNLLILAFDKGGIANEKYFENYITIPGLSETATVGQMEVAGVFDGNDEAGTIFGNAEKTKDRAILAIKHTCSPDVARAFTASYYDEEGTDELDPQKMPDKELLNNSGIPWAEKKIKNATVYTWLVTEWGSKQNMFSYGITAKGERGKIARAFIPVPEISKKDNIQLLKDLIASVETPSAKTRMTTPALLHLTPRTRNVEDFVVKSLNSQTEEIRVPFRAPEETRSAAEEMNEAQVVNSFTLTTPVR